MRQPFTIACTDDDLVPFGNGKRQPRGNGAFARKIHVYVNARHDFSIVQGDRATPSLIP
jgi:hypothetical protein